MPLIVNGTEIEHVVFKAPGVNQEVDEVYVNSTLVFVSTIFVAKPTISGSFTFDNSEKVPTITGYDPDAMAQSGTTAATAAGTYTVTYTPRSGYAWTDGTTTPVSLSWTIAKRTLTIPSLSGTTAFAYVEGATRTPTVSNFDSTYETQSGTTSSALIGNYTLTWALKYPASTQWSDGTNTNKSAAWSVGWVNGTSHYLNDIFNAGWDGAGSFTFTQYQTGGAIGATIKVNSIQAGAVGVYTNAAFSAGQTVHALIKAANSGDTLQGVNCNTAASPAKTVRAYSDSTSYVEMTWSMTQVDVDGGRSHFGIGNSGTGGFDISRIWVT